MKITTENIKALKPCTDRFNNFKSHYPNYEGSLIDFLNLDNINYEDKVWVFVRLATHIQNVGWAILCAESVLQNYESIYPNNNRPRKAIEAAEAFLLNPSEENRQVANDAYSAVRYADFTNSAAYSAHYAARSAAARSAAARSPCYVYAADAAAYFAAESAAYSANYAVASAGVAAKETQQELNLQFMVLAVS